MGQMLQDALAACALQKQAAGVVAVVKGALVQRLVYGLHSIELLCVVCCVL
jgi:hypothetical protein